MKEFGGEWWKKARGKGKGERKKGEKRGKETKGLKRISPEGLKARTDILFN